jgi:hypothetical protein
MGVSSAFLWADQPTITLATIPADCKSFAIAVGQRLQKPGKERTTATGALVLVANGVTQTSTVQIISQYPQKIRIDGAGPTLVFDASHGINGGPASQSLSALLDVLVNDSVDGMIALSNQNGALRFLGRGYKENGTSEASSAYDLVQVRFADSLKTAKTTSKMYWFDTVSKLLTRVTYLSDAGAPVEVTVGNWKKVQGEFFPFLIERRESGALGLRLTLSAVMPSPSVQDGIFGGN